MTDEEITPMWINQMDARRLLDSRERSARLQMFMYMWVHGESLM